LSLFLSTCTHACSNRTLAGMRRRRWIAYKMSPLFNFRADDQSLQEYGDALARSLASKCGYVSLADMALVSSKFYRMEGAFSEGSVVRLSFTHACLFIPARLLQRPAITDPEGYEPALPFIGIVVIMEAQDQRQNARRLSFILSPLGAPQVDADDSF